MLKAFNLLSRKMMSGKDECDNKCFTFIWKLENANYSWHETGDFIDSPSFEVNELEETEWMLRLYNKSNLKRNSIGFYLIRSAKCKGPTNIEINFELAILESDGTVLESFVKRNRMMEKNFNDGFQVPRNKVFFTRPTFSHQATLTIRCKIWKSVGSLSKDFQSSACTCIEVEKRSFLWNIQDFSSLKSIDIRTYEINSLETGEQLLLLELFLTGGQILDEKVCITASPNHQLVKTASLQLFIKDSNEHLLKCFHDEFYDLEDALNKEFYLSLTKRKLIERKGVYLPNDVLSLPCEFYYSSGIIRQKESVDSYDQCSPKDDDLAVHKSLLLEDLKTMLSGNRLSDVKLQTKSQTYPAHKCILGARSPVFEAMFASDMQEKINNVVNVDDLKDSTVTRLLNYIYKAEVGELEWDSAIELYEAADKYQILNLKNICASYLKAELCVNNSCELLILADLHQDEDLKRFVQDFILQHGADIINSEEWDQLMESNWKLAGETMRLKFKK